MLDLDFTIVCLYSFGEVKLFVAKLNSYFCNKEAEKKIIRCVLPILVYPKRSSSRRKTMRKLFRFGILAILALFLISIAVPSYAKKDKSWGGGDSSSTQDDSGKKEKRNKGDNGDKGGNSGDRQNGGDNGQSNDRHKGGGGNNDQSGQSNDRHKGGGRDKGNSGDSGDSGWNQGGSNDRGDKGDRNKAGDDRGKGDKGKKKENPSPNFGHKDDGNKNPNKGNDDGNKAPKPNFGKKHNGDKGQGSGEGRGGNGKKKDNPPGFGNSNGHNEGGNEGGKGSKNKSNKKPSEKGFGKNNGNGPSRPEAGNGGKGGHDGKKANLGRDERKRKHTETIKSWNGNHSGFKSGGDKKGPKFGNNNRGSSSARSWKPVPNGAKEYKFQRRFTGHSDQFYGHAGFHPYNECRYRPYGWDHNPRYHEHDFINWSFYYRGYVWDDPFGIYNVGWYRSPYDWAWGPRYIYRDFVIIEPEIIRHRPLYIYISDDGLTNAIDDIASAWVDSDSDMFANYISDENVRLYYDGKYDASISPADFNAMTMDAMSMVNVSRMNLFVKSWLSPTEVFLSGSQVFTDPDGYGHTVYVSYILKKMDGDWYITAYGRSDTPIACPYKDFRF